MHAVCETHAFRRAAERVGLCEDDITAIVTYLAANPTAGDEMSGTGGCRKLRWPGRGKGKSGGYRTITFYSGEMCPVYLITIFGKGEKASLSKGERNGLARIAKALTEDSFKKVTKAVAKSA